MALFGPFAIEGGKLPKKIFFYLYTKYDFYTEICLKITLTQKNFFWQFSPFLLQKAHLIEEESDIDVDMAFPG